ncbi:nuclease Le1 [Desarmillaria ectypa]|nr:nuclease Le1 [Desarmillaria ectypa]
MKYATLTAVIVSFLPKVYGWGASGHEAVGAIAQQFLASEASSFVASTLASGETLSSAATWADNVRTESAFAWSSPLHFVDAEVLARYLSHETARTENAFFIGDIGQPLHVEAFELGGNDISARCSGSSTNLHAVWDSGIINKRLKADFGNSVSSWASTLATRIKSGEYASLKSDWISCSSTTEQARRELRNVETDIKGHLASRATTPLECPHIWAVEANELNCEFVFTYTKFSDLCSTSYYDDAIPLIELQIAKQGFRLAAWLNVLFDGSTDL